MDYGTAQSELGAVDPQSQPSLSAACDGVLTTAGDVALPNLKRGLRGFACIPRDATQPPEEVWIDKDTGATADLRELKRLDAVAFKEAKGAIDSNLETALQSATASGQVSAEVWVAVDESGLPSKDDADSQPPAAAQAALESRIRAALTDVIRAIAEYNQSSTGAPITIVSNTRTQTWGAPRLHVTGTPEQIRWLGRRDTVTRVLPAPGPGVLFGSAVYYDVDLEAWLDNQTPGADGTGLTVAVWEPDRWDSLWNLRGVGSGSCTPTSGNNSGLFLFHCGAAGATPQDYHGRQVAGVVRNGLFSQGGDGVGGMADDVRLIDANTGGNCTTNGPEPISSALNWAIAQGASVINQSWGLTATGLGSPSNSLDLLDDYVAVHSPYPLIVAAAGNSGPTARVANNLRNGLVVGASDDHGSTTRTAGTIATFSSTVNWGGSTGYEVPHLVAPGTALSVVGDLLGEIETDGGTSFSAPQVAGMAASLQEENVNLKQRPELMMAGLLASADVNVDGAWPLNLNDGVDDKDGAGLVNALNAAFILHPSVAFPNGGNAASQYGHAYGTATPANFPAGTWNTLTWNATVAPNQRLRVASAFMGTVTCGSPASASNCSSEKFPTVGLYIYDGNNVLAGILNANDNYQFTSALNGASAKTWTIKLFMSDWSGLSSSFFGLAWLAQ